MDFKKNNLDVQNIKAGVYKENLKENAGLVKSFHLFKTIVSNSNRLQESKNKHVH